MEINIKGNSIIGKRNKNEDSFIFFRTFEGYYVVAVADGMGGHHGGEVASRLSLKILKKELENIKLKSQENASIERTLLHVVKKIHNQLLKAAQEEKSLMDMGTTLNFNIFLEKENVTLNIGDSRTIMYDLNSLKQITHDQNLASIKNIENKFSSKKQLRNYLYSSLGPRKETRIDIYFTPRSKKGFTILTTDGAHNHLSEREWIYKLKDTVPLEDKVDGIIKTAYDNNSKDNITVVIAEY